MNDEVPAAQLYCILLCSAGSRNDARSRRSDGTRNRRTAPRRLINHFIIRGTPQWRFSCTSCVSRHDVDKPHELIVAIVVCASEEREGSTIHAEPTLHCHGNGEVALKILHNVVDSPRRKHHTSSETSLLRDEKQLETRQKRGDLDTHSSD